MIDEFNEPQAEYRRSPKPQEDEQEPLKKRVSLEEYLEMIADGDRRLEYHTGEVIDIQPETNCFC